jgi:O-antigen/teichoic acid export membrane protein
VTLLGPLFTIFFTPLYTRVLEPADYGVVDVSLAVSSLLSIFALLGTDQALSAHFFDGDSTYRSNLVITAVIGVCAAGLITGTCIAAAAVPLARFLFDDPWRRYIVYLLAINAVSAPVYNVTSAALRLQMDIRRVNVLGLVYLIATVVCNMLLVLVFHLKATGIVAANVLANVFASSLSLILARDAFRGSFSFALLKPLTRSGLSLVPGLLSTFGLSSVNRLLLTQSVSQSDIGLYAIANRLGSMLYVLRRPVDTAWWPLALEMADQPDAPRQYARLLEYLLSAAMLASLAVGIFAPEILATFTRSAYVPAAPMVLALLVYFGPVGEAFSSFQIALYIRKRTELISVLLFVSAIVNVALNLLLNPVIGVWGAIWGTVLAGAVLTIVAYAMAQRLYPVPYRLPRLFALTAVYLVLTAAFLLEPTLNTLAYKVGALLLFAVAVLCVGVISRRQIQVALQSARHHLTRLTRGR